MSPSRPPLRRAAPEQARSGFPFLIGMAALVLAAAIGSVARFCPQDLRFEGGGKHPAKTAMTPTPAEAATVTTPIPPTTFTTVGAPAPTVITAPATTTAPTTAKKKPPHAPRTRAGTAPAASASAAASASTAALPENPYPEASPPEAYGF